MNSVMQKIKYYVIIELVVFVVFWVVDIMDIKGLTVEICSSGKHVRVIYTPLYPTFI